MIFTKYAISSLPVHGLTVLILPCALLTFVSPFFAFPINAFYY